jgi:hypothetical protein
MCYWALLFMPLVILHHLLNVFVQLENKRGLKKRIILVTENFWCWNMTVLNRRIVENLNEISNNKWQGRTNKTISELNWTPIRKDSQKNESYVCLSCMHLKRERRLSCSQIEQKSAMTECCPSVERYVSLNAGYILRRINIVASLYNKLLELQIVYIFLICIIN